MVAQYANFYENATEEILRQFYDSSCPSSLQHTSLKINPQSFLDVLLLEIRRVTISFSSKCKRQRQAREQALIEEIKYLESLVENRDYSDTFQDHNEALKEKKAEYEEILAVQAEGAFIRSRAQYKVEGEKPSKIFCSLEKHNAVQKYIPKLVLEEENRELLKQSDIENEAYRYYKDLFSKKKDSPNPIEDFLDDCATSLPKISDGQKSSMEGLITETELTSYLKKSKNNVSPGSSGFTSEFYKFFWRDLRSFIANSINFGCEMGKLSITQRLGVITLIPKGDKNKALIKNWRPLTLLNTLYKMVSGCIAERIKPHLDSIIHPNQKGFIAGRFIGEAIRTTYDVLHWAKMQKRAGILLLIDFEKAYDSLSFSFIKKCLNYLNFGESIVSWISLLLNNFSAVLNHCGNLSRLFPIERGARQGDPIASYIFIISIEILAHKLRNSEKIDGFNLLGRPKVLEMYADDCSIFLEPTETNLKNAVEILIQFYELSGLKISLSKTKAIWFGINCRSRPNMCQSLNLDWVNSFKLLGVFFTNDLVDMDSNYGNKIKEIQKLLNNWINRTLSVYGKMVIIKCLALPKISHLAMVLPSLDSKQIKELENLLFSFLWDRKPDKVSREHAKLSEKAGGLGMIDIKDFWLSLKFSWLRRCLKTKSSWLSILEDSLNRVLKYNSNIVEILQFGPNQLCRVGKELSNDFWKPVFCGVKAFMQGAIFCDPENIVTSPFWDNLAILRNNKVIKRTFFPGLSDEIFTLADLLCPTTGDLLSWAEMTEVYKYNITQETYVELKYIFKITKTSLGLPESRRLLHEKPYQPLLISLINKTVRGCSVYYRFLRKYRNLNTNLAARENKWHDELGYSLEVTFWNNVYVLTSSIRHENKMKWLQYQINRNCLYTSQRVNRFKNHVSPFCVFCSERSYVKHLELVSHLFYDCEFTYNFWCEMRTWLLLLEMPIDLPLDKVKIIFGLSGKKNEMINYILLCGKYFIWRERLDSKSLSFVAFKRYFKTILDQLRNALIFEEKLYLFEPWLIIYDVL